MTVTVTVTGLDWKGFASVERAARRIRTFPFSPSFYLWPVWSVDRASREGTAESPLEMDRDPQPLMIFGVLRGTALSSGQPTIHFLIGILIMYLGTEALPARLASAFSQGLVDLDGSDIGETPGAPELDHRSQPQTLPVGLLILSLPSMTTAVPSYSSPNPPRCTDCT